MVFNHAKSGEHMDDVWLICIVNFEIIFFPFEDTVLMSYLFKYLLLLYQKSFLFAGNLCLKYIPEIVKEIRV